MNHLQDASEEITKPETQYEQAKNKNAQARFGTFSGPTHIWKQNSDFHKPPFPRLGCLMTWREQKHFNFLTLPVPEKEMLT